MSAIEKYELNNQMVWRGYLNKIKNSQHKNMPRFVVRPLNKTDAADMEKLSNRAMLTGTEKTVHANDTEKVEIIPLKNFGTYFPFNLNHQVVIAFCRGSANMTNPAVEEKDSNKEAECTEKGENTKYAVSIAPNKFRVSGLRNIKLPA